MIRVLRLQGFLGLCALAIAMSTASAELRSISVHDLAQTAPALQQSFYLAELGRAGEDQTALKLRPVQIFTDDARLVLNAGERKQELPMPAVFHFSGHELGRADNLAFVSVHPDGSVRGWLRNGAGIETFSLEARRSETARIETMVLDGPTAADRQFSCGADQLPQLPGMAVDRGFRTNPQIRMGAEVTHIARLALDTDTEYFSLFNDVEAAAVYAADLVGLISGTYSHDLQVGLQLPYLRLWTEGSDPWSESSTSCRLYQFSKHWNDEMEAVERSLAHMLSARPGGGLAWGDTLCRFDLQANSGSGCSGFSGTGNYAGAYGLNEGIQGSADPADPQLVWDWIVLAHEIGHTFNSPHSHCYGGIGGNPDPVDGCFTEPQSSGCPGPHSGVGVLPGPQGQGSGTIMSYCHLRAGGLSNIGNSLGLGHPYGNAPERVPARMRSRMLLSADIHPGCLVILPEVFADRFESP